MATTGALAVVFLQIFSLYGRIYGSLDDLGVINNQAGDLDGRFKTLLSTASGYSSLENDNLTVLEVHNMDNVLTESNIPHYNMRKPRIQLKRVDGLDAVKTMARNIGNMLQRKVDALNASVVFAEKLAESYDWNPNLELESVEWVNSKKVNESGEGYAHADKFKQRVNYQNSSVHIPVEIYEGDIKILNGLTWTTQLEEIWRKNLEKDKDLLWQYFGSQSGIFRKYPASKWRGKGVDLYDVRRRPWYTQGASSPKDMLILVDTSGSTHGQALTLMKQSVRSLIDTLGENDFVNIAHFSDTAGIVGCFKTFVQANHINKQILYNSIDTMEAKGMASYSLGLKFAFTQFEEFYEKAEEGEGARCNSIIMLLTDGGTEMPEDVIRKYNWPEKKIRIFGYAVGPTANPVAAVKWIACSNKGYFARIPAMGAIRSTVQDHVSVVSRPLALQAAPYQKWSTVYLDALQYQAVTARALAISAAVHLSWSPPYMDFLNYVPVLARPRAINNIKEASWTNVRYDRGLGMMTTVTLPVYNKTEDIANQTILGVMGCDVTVDEMLAFTPTKMLGASGYVFAINANGYVMFHPNLKAQNGWLDDPPNVDFLDVEHDTPEKQALRKDMINAMEASRVITGYAVTPDEAHLDNITRTYYYTRIPGTNFSLALVTDGEQSYYLDSADPSNGTDDNTTTERFLSSDYTAILLAPWTFCNEVVTIHNNSASLDEMLYQIKNDNSNCNSDLIDHLLFDAMVTSNIENVWKSISSVGIDARFLTTAGGLTRVYPSSANESFRNDLDPKKSQYYQRAMNTDDWTFFAKYHNGIVEPNATDPVVTAVKSIVLPGPEKFKPAVAGVRIEQPHLRDKLLTAVPSCGNPDILCYLLDDSGYLILSSDDEDRFKVGQFFGDVDVVLMKHLINTTVYLKNEKYDYQAACPIEKPTVSAGPRSVFVPAVMDMLTVNWWTTKFAWMYMQFNIYDWLSGYLSHAEAAAMNGGEESDEGNRSCVKLMTQYYFNEDPVMRTYKDEAVCGNCTREYATVRLRSSNLLLVMVEGDCDGVCDVPILNSVPVEKTIFEESTTSGTCKVEKRFRIRPAECYDYDIREDDGDCGAGSALLPSMAVLVVLQVVALCLSVRGHVTC